MLLAKYDLFPLFLFCLQIQKTSLRRRTALIFCYSVLPTTLMMCHTNSWFGFGTEPNQLISKNTPCSSFRSTKKDLNLLILSNGRTSKKDNLFSFLGFVRSWKEGIHWINNCLTLGQYLFNPFLILFYSIQLDSIQFNEWNTFVEVTSITHEDNC